MKAKDARYKRLMLFHAISMSLAVWLFTGSPSWGFFSWWCGLAVGIIDVAYREQDLQ